MKRKSTQLSTHSFSKKLRSKLPRRRRTQISPILQKSGNSTVISVLKASSLVPSLNSNCDEVSCNTTRDSGAGARNDAFLRVTRSVTRQREIERARSFKGVEIEVSVSEKSCVESCSVAAEAESKLQRKSNGELCENSEKFSDQNLHNDVVRDCDSEISAITRTFEKSYEEEGGGISNLVCSENFSCDEVSSTTFPEVESDVFAGDSEFDFSDEYTPSMWLDSGSQFSEKSVGDSTPSPCFSLFKQYYEQFSKFSSSSSGNAFSPIENLYSDDFAFRRFDDSECEESYRILRSRERNQAVKVSGYTEEYDLVIAHGYGDLIVEQRLLMVNWIIEVSDKRDLHNETTFLGVRLLDRFLSRGYFRSKRNLQLLGIACLTLATRIEENQPYNSVLQKTFYVESNVYSRCEVVAMEWVVQEVLQFQCISPTSYNFLWFYLKAARADEEMERRTKYLAQLAMLDHRQLRFWPSTVAAGLVILVSLTSNRDASCIRVIETHVRTDIDDLPECLKSLEWLVKYAS